MSARRMLFVLILRTYCPSAVTPRSLSPSPSESVLSQQACLFCAFSVGGLARDLCPSVFGSFPVLWHSL